MRRRLIRGIARRLRRLAEDDQARPLDGLRARVVVAGLLRVAPRFARRADRLDGSTVEWRITRPDGGASLRTMVFADDRLRVRRGIVAEPDLVVQLTAGDFYALALGAADPVTLATKGRLTVSGDLDLGFRLPTAFGRR